MTIKSKIAKSFSDKDNLQGLLTMNKLVQCRLLNYGLDMNFLTKAEKLQSGISNLRGCSHKIFRKLSLDNFKTLTRNY